MSHIVFERGIISKQKQFSWSLRNFKIGPFFLILSLLVFVILVTLMTLLYSTSQVTQGYVLEEMDMSNQDLEQQLQLHEMKIAEVRSIEHIRSLEQVANMRPMTDDKIVYIEGGTAIASK